MGIAAVITIATAATAATIENAQHTRRLASQRADGARIDQESAMKAAKAKQDLEENRTYSKILRQRQRAMAANAAAPKANAAGTSLLTSGSASLGTPGGAAGGGKKSLGS